MLDALNDVDAVVPVIKLDDSIANVKTDTARQTAKISAAFRHPKVSEPKN